MAIEENLSRPSSRYRNLVFFIFTIGLVFTFFLGLEISAQNAKDNSVYQELDLDQFFTKWFVLGPIRFPNEKTSVGQASELPSDDNLRPFSEQFEANPPFSITDLPSVKIG